LKHAAHVVTARWAVAVGVCAALGWLFFAASFTIGRHGFSPDEEITALVVRGIAETGAPVLPSGMVYLRGLPYSYAAWLTGSLVGHDLVAYRATSLVFALLAVVLIFLVTRAVSTPAAGVVAALVFAASPLLVSAAVFARFYAAFVAAALLALWLLVRRQPDMPVRFWPFLCAILVARLLHEFAAVLALLPLCLAATEPRVGARRGLLFLSAASFVLLLMTQFVFIGVEAWSVPGGAGALSARLAVFGNADLARPPTTYFDLAAPLSLAAIALAVVLLAVAARAITGVSWPGLAAYATCSFFFQMGAVLAVLAAAILARPARVVPHLKAALLIGGGSAALWVAHSFAVTDAAPSLRIGSQMAATTFGYPWEAIRYFFEAFTWLTVAAAGAVAWQVIGARRTGAPDGRGLALFTFVSLVALGLTAGEFQWRYVLLVMPPVLVAAAQLTGLAGDLVSRFIPEGRSTWLAGAAAMLLATAALAVNQYQGVFRDQALAPRSMAGMLALPTDDSWEPDAFRTATSPDDLIVCNDEAACQYLLGRVDYWLQPSPDITARYVTAAATPRGVYTGARVLSTQAELGDVVARADRPVSIVMLDTGKFDDSASRAMTSALTCRYGATTTGLGGRHELIRFPLNESRPTNQGARR
jgi:hypothetical protein